MTTTFQAAIPANPYSDSRPVSQPGQFVGRHAEVRQLVENFGATIPQSVALYGRRGVGKTSLVKFASHAEGGLKEFRSLLATESDRYVFAYVDLELLQPLQPNQASDSDRLAFFRLIFSRVHQAVMRTASLGDGAEKLRGFFSANAYSDNVNSVVDALDQYLELLTETQLTVVVLLDEADLAIMWGVGNSLRAFLAERRLAYVLVTRQPLQDIDPEGVLSPLYGVCKHMRLGMLDDSDARELVTRPIRGLQVALSEEDIEFVLRTAGPHPHFIKTVAGLVFDAQRGYQQQTDYVDLYRQAAGALFGSCQRLWRSLRDEETRLVGRICAGQPSPLQTLHAISNLIDEGIVIRSASDHYGVFSPIFAEYARARYQSQVGGYSVGSLSDPAAVSQGSDVGPEVNFEDDHILLDGLRIPMTPLESRLLRYLFSNANRICSRRDIYENVWGGGYDEEKDATVNMTVQRLRSKLKSDPADRLLIESKRGQGYLLTSSR